MAYSSSMTPQQQMQNQQEVMLARKIRVSYLFLYYGRDSPCHNYSLLSMQIDRTFHRPHRCSSSCINSGSRFFPVEWSWGVKREKRGVGRGCLKMNTHALSYPSF